jgi:predicted extracellular nuclease
LTYQTYCNGFQANASGASVLVDTYDYAQSPGACASQDNGATLSHITGIWYDTYGAYAIAIRSCADLGSSSTYAGTGSAPSTPQGSQTVAAFLASHPADGATVTVSGVVVGVSVNVDGDVNFGLEDPNGGPNASTGVYKAGGGASQAATPSVGDYVTVTGSWSQSYQNIGL